jgi:SP family facilitated glucose transporter-like MFS transporter 1
VWLIEWLGRRTLMLYGLGGMAVFFLFFTSMFCFQVRTHSSCAALAARELE